VLPPDLRSAEVQMLEALDAALAAAPAGRWTVELRFEGLKLLPLALRLLRARHPGHPPARLLFPDAGATALAQRDASDLAGAIGSLRDQRRLQEASAEGGSSGLLIVAGPAAADYEAFEPICAAHRGPLALLNGSLEDAAVGIGSVARQRRRGFLSTWRTAYALLPLRGGALRLAFPGEWELYRRDPDGYRQASSFERRPDAEQVALALDPGQVGGVAGNLEALERFLGTLSQ
jgi:hypothetical protein